MRIDLEGQVVLVTGAGRGIGAAIARRAAGAGAQVVLTARSEAELGTVADQIRAAGGRAEPIPADLSGEGEVARLVKETLERCGRIDGLVNNAGTNSIANLVMMKDSELRRVFELNVFAVFALSQAVVRTMIRARAGRIINISSVSAKIGASYNSAYAASKAAILGLTRSLAKETAKVGITVNAVCPWHVDTELVREAMEKRAKLFGKSGAEYLEEIISHSPQQRLIEADEVAALTVFLLSREARGITGQSLNVDGGVVME